MGVPKRAAVSGTNVEAGQRKKNRSTADAQPGQQRGKRRRNEDGSDGALNGDQTQNGKRAKEVSSRIPLSNGHKDQEQDIAQATISAPFPSSSSPKGARLSTGRQNGTDAPAARAGGAGKASGGKGGQEDSKDGIGGRRVSFIRRSSVRDSFRESESADGRKEVVEKRCSSVSTRTRGEETPEKKRGRGRGAKEEKDNVVSEHGVWQFASYLLTEAVSADNPDDAGGEAGSSNPQAAVSGSRFWDQIPPFMQVPLKLEATLTVGVMVCADSFLFNFTLLPLRTASGLLSYLYRLLRRLSGLEGGRVRSCAREDIVRASLLALSVVGLHMVDISYLYHYIRGQMSSYIKLYVIFNVLEVLDKLFCSLGQDVFDKMAMWSQGGGRGRTSAFDTLFLIIFLVMAFVYVLLHSTVLLVQVVTLNVAINSQNNALFTLLVANNFTELKGQVFKKFEENALLQVMCADIVERFQLAVFLGLVTLQNLSEDAGGWDQAWLQDWASMVLIVWGTEYVVDWIKHSFVTKFNKIEPEVYNRYRAVIWEHTCNAWRLRQPHRVARHVGFISLPLSCVVARVGSHSLSPNSKRYVNAHWRTLLPVGLVWWSVLCLLKIWLYLLLLGHACHKHQAAEEQEREQEREREESLKPQKDRLKSQKDRAGTPNLSHQLPPAPSTQDAAVGASVAVATGPVPAPLSNLMGVEMFVRAPKGQVDQVPPAPAYSSPVIRHMPSPHGEVQQDTGSDSSMPKLTL